MHNNNYFLYVIKCSKDSRIYYGSSRFKDRYKSHLYNAFKPDSNGNLSQKPLHIAVRKYGSKYFEGRILIAFNTNTARQDAQTAYAKILQAAKANNQPLFNI